MEDRRIEAYAKRSFLALKNPYGSVAAVHPGIIDRVAAARVRHGNAFYMGIKNTPIIPRGLIKGLEEHGFLDHTRDQMSLGGRAVDLRLVNPLTGRWMTGSSSGTALNVFYGMNDLGVGTDGGGSVLAPAAALNLLGFISPLMEKEEMKQYEKLSTDGISFSPSLGFIARDLDMLRRGVCAAFGWAADLKEKADTEVKMRLGTDTGRRSKIKPAARIMVDEGIDIYGPRESLIPYVMEHVVKGKILVSQEGPVDVQGMGDSVFGHFDERTGKQQRMARKGLMRVVNMCGKSAIAIPGKGLGITTLLICESRTEDIQAMLRVAEEYCCPGSRLVERYFLNLDMYY